MNSQLVFQIVQGSLTLLIAASVAWIGYQQWRTAHDRVRLDLFDRRMKVYDELSAVISNVIGHGSVNNTDSQTFLRATRNVEFLFGGAVEAYLDEIYEILVKHHAIEARFENQSGVELDKALNEREALFSRISHFHRDFRRIVMPYMKLDQKLPRWWWSYRTFL